MLKKLTIICIIAMFAFSNAFSNGLSLNNIGGKSLGMAGAYTSINGDATAIYWNPAGLSFLDRGQINAFFTGVMPSGTYKLDMAGIDAETQSNLYPTGGLMAFIPLGKGPLSFGIGVFVPAGLGAEWNGDDLVNITQETSYNWMSQIGRVDFSPTVSYLFSDQFAVGAGVNISYGIMDIEMARGFDLQNPQTGEPMTVFTQYTESSSGIGFSVNVGLVFKPTDKLSFGLSFKTKNTVAFEGDAEMPIMADVGQAIGKTVPTESKFSRDVAWPMWFGGGISYEVIEGLTLAFDATWSQWSATEDELATSYDEWDDTFATIGQADATNLVLHWEDALQLRFGAQYEASKDLTLRLGFYTDPGPAPDETYNIIFPSIDYNAVTTGITYDMGSFGIDLAMEYLMGTERDIQVQTANNMPGLHNMNMLVWTFGINYYFDD